MQGVITMDHGSGGEKTAELVEGILRPAFANPELDALGDGALLVAPPAKELAFSTDSFVITPLEFPGGDIGKLSVCGTVNDLAMCGARPLWLSFGLILEEGLSLDLLQRVVRSAAEQAKHIGVKIVTGDTKVVEHGRGDGIYINTAGVGAVEYPGLSPEAIRPGDAVILSGTIGDHGTAVLLAREGLGLSAEGLASDCAPLYDLARAVWQAAPNGALRCLRDPTRGGVATTLNEFAEGRDFGIQLTEAALPVRPQVRAACELLGLDPLYCANEGKLLAVVEPGRAEAVLQALRALPGGKNAAHIGTVSKNWPGRLTLHTPLGADRVLARLAGAQLPRIC